MPHEKYPACAKLAAVREDSQKLGEFLDWLAEEKKIVLATWQNARWAHSGDDEPEEELVTVITSREKLLAEYFEIDLKQVEDERQQMLKSIRADNAARDATERA